MCLISPSLYSTPALLSYNWTFWTQGSQNSSRSLLFVNIVNTLRSSWTDRIASWLSFSLPLKWEMGLNSYSCKCRNQSFFPVTRPAPTSIPFTFSPRNVNCCGDCERWFSRESAATPPLDIWAIGFSGPCFHGFSPIIGSARLINGGHCRWTLFPTESHNLLQHSITHFPWMDKISLHITRMYCHKLIKLWYRFIIYRFIKDSSATASISWPVIFF